LCDGLEAAREIQQECPNVKTVMLTASENEKHVQLALQSGVNGYIVKGCSGPELLRIIRTVQNCESYITPALAAPPSDTAEAASCRHRHPQRPEHALTDAFPCPPLARRGVKPTPN
jgi:DNA-binding NarL/FixJ family response regulator